MKLATFLLLLLISIRTLPAQTAPFDPAAWPPTIDKTKKVHFKVVNDTLEAPQGAAGWDNSTVTILSGGDQETVPLQVSGQEGLRAGGIYLNFADTGYADWAEEPVIDILMQVYGDAAILDAAGDPRNFNFLIGVLPAIAFPVGGQAPPEAKNFKWNWILFRINNDQRADGGRFVGTLPDGAVGDFTRGGVNGGTFRMENVPGLGVRVVAFGQQGAFGEPEEINTFASSDVCQPEPETNLVWLDFNHTDANHLVMLDEGDQQVELEEGIGPVDDKRRALRASGSYMNFGITDNYLGLKCNDPHPVKVCVEYYDDPARAGESFGPEAYATDPTNGVGFVPAAKYQVLEGSGKWKRRSWLVGGVNLRGVNTGADTGGPRLYFSQPVSISRIDMAVLREGLHPLAGQDPLANCQTGPGICEGAYGDYAEMDLASGLLDGLAPGTSGGDQEMIQEEAGPANDRRPAVRPAGNDGSPQFAHLYLNFSITEQRLGPTSQPNARLAVAMTYFDDPALAGQSFRPEVYRTEKPDGAITFQFVPGSQTVTLQGSNRWVESYFELDGVKFEGVNQGPQAAARFATTGKIAFSRVRYAVIRPCGANAGRNLLDGAKPPITAVRENDVLRLRWAAGQNWNLQYIDPHGDNIWQPVTEAPTVTDFQNVVEFPVGDPPTRFYRLVK
ncbi:MAG: hypothetical protein JWM59_1825 [Verrucomicrobiales bacterium]|nr:hypothetical protein [Verrucomicrobiales bacterium]